MCHTFFERTNGHTHCNVPLCCRCCALVRCGNPELTCNDEFPLFTADNMTFPCAELFILQKNFCFPVGWVCSGRLGGLDPLPPSPAPPPRSSKSLPPPPTPTPLPYPPTHAAGVGV